MRIIDRFKWRPASLVILGKNQNYATFFFIWRVFDRVEKDENAKFAEEEEMLRKNFTEKVRAEESRFRNWEQQVTTNTNKENNEIDFDFFE